MKTCERCGDEIGTRDGENLCFACDELSEDRDRKASAKRAKARAARRARDEALRSCGLVKVRGSMGGTYWE